jgi:hypothetical protein
MRTKFDVVACWQRTNWRRLTGTAARTTGTYAVGPMMHNTTPVAGGNLGWICVASGSPGTWKAYGVNMTQVSAGASRRLSWPWKLRSVPRSS